MADPNDERTTRYILAGVGVTLGLALVIGIVAVVATGGLDIGPSFTR